jgi:hypothetical protein
VRVWLLLIVAVLLIDDDATIAHQRRWEAVAAKQAAGLQGALESLEYQPTKRAWGLSAPNRAQGLRLAFDESGMAVATREGGEPLVALGLTAFGRGGVLQAVGTAPAQTSDGSKVERRWAGITEWFLNLPSGVEHGWTVDERVVGSGPLLLAVAVAGVHADVSEDEARLLTTTGRVLHYGSLSAHDASGAKLPARMSASSEGLRIEVDDTAARYPIIIDPLLTTSAWTAERNRALSQFGVSVATAGDVNGDGYSDVVVGAHLFDNGEANEGLAFLYLGSASGLSLAPVWTAESNQSLARFGSSVASAGDVNGDGYSDVFVGAPSFSNGEPSEGRAFLYLGSASGLSPTPAWTAEGNQLGVSFGSSLAAAGDVNGDGFGDVVVGALYFTNGEAQEGRAFLYLGSASGLSPTPAWTAESDLAVVYFGSSVASAGDVNGDGYSDVVVGAYGFRNGENTEGRAFLYLGGASGLAATPAWTAESDQAVAIFGYSVASAGDVNGDGYSDVVVGAGQFTNGESQEGRAYLYLGGASGLSPMPSWTAEGNQVAANFGWSVASAGDVNGDGYSDVVVGGSSFDNGEADEGRASLYLGSAAGLGPAPAWTAESNQASAQYGVTVASAGDVNGDGYSDVVVGASTFDNGETDEGRAFLYSGNASGLSLAPSWTGEDTQASANFGYSVASVGDVNGDGYSDVVVGAPTFDNGETDEGRVFVYLGSASGLSVAPAWTAEGNQANGRFGFSVASAGDVNGDGYADVVVGADFFDNGQLDEGRAFLYLGSASGLSVAPAWTAESNQASANFGYSVASAGDVNGDGYSDVVVGAELFDNGEVDEGRAFLYLGSASGLSLTPAWTAEGNQANAWFGKGVASAGDVNSDGYSDVVVGAELFDNVEVNEGRAFLYLGSAGGLSLAPAWTAENNQPSASFGLSVAGAGDVNGDGYSDVVVGAPAGAGQAFLYSGAASGLSSTASWTVGNFQPSAAFGISVGSAGDVNGDGFADVVVGARFFDNGQTDEGRAFLFLGSATGLGLTASWTAESDQASSLFGSAVASAGDVNGDGFADVVVGAYAFDNDQSNEGRVFLYLGGDAAPGLPRGLAQQLDGGTSSGAIARGVAPVSLSALGFNALATQGRVALETEVKSLGAPFDGSGLVRSSLGLARQRQTAVRSALPPGRYHWRARLVSGQERGRWLSFGGNAEAEADFAIVPLPVDGGQVDAGQEDAGQVDAGEVDAGEVDAGPRGLRRDYAVGCDCGTTSGSPAVLLALIIWRASRRQGRLRRRR